MSVSAEFRKSLDDGFRAAATAVEAAENWKEAQGKMVAGTYPYLVAIQRAEEGWTEEEIRRELGIRLGLGKMYEAEAATFQPGH
jgi:hypothetical protein